MLLLDKDNIQMENQIILGDCLEKLKELTENSIDSIVTDPPYGISFMNKAWDYELPSIEIFKEMLRVLKPGGHMLCACGTRTQHRMVCNIEDAGFEIRDVITWMYAQGFPKALDVNKKINACTCGGNAIPYSNEKTKHNMRSMPEADIPKAVNAENKQGKVLQSSLSEQSTQKHREERPESKITEREQSSLEGRQLHRTSQGLQDDKESKTSESETKRLCVGTHSSNGENDWEILNESGRSTPHKSQQTRQHHQESKAIRYAQKPLDGESLSRCSKCQRPILPSGIKTALKPACEFFTLCRKPLSEKTVAENVLKWGTGGINIDGSRIGNENISYESRLTKNRNLNDDNWNKIGDKGIEQNVSGRFPANLILDPEAGKMLDEQSGELTSGSKPGQKGKPSFSGDGSLGTNKGIIESAYGDSGGASRFFYTAKASSSERNEGCDLYWLDGKQITFDKYNELLEENEQGKDHKISVGNVHSTVKPTDLMEYLIKLITPPQGIVLDPFMGSGTTCLAAFNLERKYIGIELNEEYFEIAKARIFNNEKQLKLF